MTIDDQLGSFLTNDEPVSHPLNQSVQGVMLRMVSRCVAGVTPGS